MPEGSTRARLGMLPEGDRSLARRRKCLLSPSRQKWLVGQGLPRFLDQAAAQATNNRLAGKSQALSVVWVLMAARLSVPIRRCAGQ